MSISNPRGRGEGGGEEERDHHHQQQQQGWGGGSSDEGVMKAATRWDQSWERRGCRGTMLLSAAEKKVRVQTERHDNFCPPALCFAP